MEDKGKLIAIGLLVVFFIIALTAILMNTSNRKEVTEPTALVTMIT
ncbi:hypothetical protein SAMN02910298_01979 [Pseudobutyrivibrio sp. YE44]|nr:hypothetical protein [Pseudobutyrivibrio sp. YE44]SDB40365.1 hypothetical protein SAMN02910298_01979 [Pseudobutyrivibrio sp. YE44]